MYRALYDYKTKLPQYISFQTGDKFTILDSSRNDWFYAQNGIGQLGYIPTNYIEKIDVASSDIIKFIDGSIEAVHYQATSAEGVYDHQLREVLRNLIEHRSVVIGEIKHPPDESLPSQSESGSRSPQQAAVSSETNATDDHKEKPTSTKRSPAPPPPAEDILQKSSKDFSPNSELSDPAMDFSSPVDSSSFPIKYHRSSGAVSPNSMHNLPIPEDLGAQLVEEIRTNTQLSYVKSKTAVETVLGYIGYKVPQLTVVMDKIVDSLKAEHHEASKHDVERLEVIFSELRACKDDSQQRGWALHEDEFIIMEYLQELLSILENAKLSVTHRAVSQDRYEIVLQLVQYYQMETRLRIRLLLLKVFGAMCGLNKMVITTMLFSVLPLELSTEILTKSDDVRRLRYVSLVMTMLFSTGETVPANLHDHLDESFIGHILSLIEDPPTPVHASETTDMLINLILAMNLHFTDIDSNLIMETLSTQRSSKELTEKVMLLFNREDDPVCMFDHLPLPEHSVIKFMKDLYSSCLTANLLYGNDAIVLIDIIIRQLANLPAGDNTRTSYLKLMKLVLENSNYKEKRHRQRELYTLLRSISLEEASSKEDKTICAYILSFPGSSCTSLD